MRLAPLKVVNGNESSFFGDVMPLIMIARSIIGRLRENKVEIGVAGDGSMSFFIPSPGSFGRPVVSEHRAAFEDGGIKELVRLIRTAPALQRAVRDVILRKDKGE